MNLYDENQRQPHQTMTLCVNWTALNTVGDMTKKKYENTVPSLVKKKTEQKKNEHSARKNYQPVHVCGF